MAPPRWRDTSGADCVGIYQAWGSDGWVDCLERRSYAAQPVHFRPAINWRRAKVVDASSICRSFAISPFMKKVRKNWTSTWLRPDGGTTLARISPVYTNLGAAIVGLAASKGILTPPSLRILTLLSTGVGRNQYFSPPVFFLCVPSAQVDFIFDVAQPRSFAPRVYSVVSLDYLVFLPFYSFMIHYRDWYSYLVSWAARYLVCIFKLYH